MLFMDKLLDIFKLESTREAERERKNEKELSPYHAITINQRQNNLDISYTDIEKYSMKPFDLNKPFLTDGDFTVVGLDGENLQKAYCYLSEVHRILEPFLHLYKGAAFPNRIGLDSEFFRPIKLPVSYIRLTPYTATRKESKYPFYLLLSFYGYYGVEYWYVIYFDQSGEIGKCDLSLQGSNGAKFSYQSKIRRNKDGLYVMRIDKTIYVEPYGTKILYHYSDEIEKQEQNKKPKSKHMSAYDIERYARECNAYVIREERKEVL